MKKINLRSSEKNPALKSKTIFGEAIKAPPSQGGLNVVEMRKRMRVYEALEAAKDTNTLELEDADYATLRDAVTAMQWGIFDPELLQILEDVEAPE